MDTLGVAVEAVLLESFDLDGAEVDVDEHPDNSMAATATPETPKLSFFIVLFIYIFPLIFYVYWRICRQAINRFSSFETPQSAIKAVTDRMTIPAKTPVVSNAPCA